MADAAIIAMAESGSVNGSANNALDPSISPDIGEDQLTNDDLAVWYRYSTQASDAWDYEHDAEVSSPAPYNQESDHEDDFRHHEDLISAYDAYNEDLPGHERTGSQYTSSNNSTTASRHNFNESGNGAEPNKCSPPSLFSLILQCPGSVYSLNPTYELPSFTFPIQEPSLWLGMSSNISNLAENAFRRPLDATESRLSQDLESSMARDDESFWAVTASLLGPDFDFDAKSIKDHINVTVAPETQQQMRAKAILSSISRSRPDLSQSLAESTLVARPALPRDPGNSPILDSRTYSLPLLEALLSLGQSWHLFTTLSSLQTYIDTLKHSHDFGVCFLDQDGSRCCCIMRARETKRIYSLPAADYWESKDASSSYEFPDPGCKATFWWCRPGSSSTEPDLVQMELCKELDRRYEAAKLLINTVKSKTMNAKTAKLELDVAYQRLLLDLPVRERLAGRFSLEAMNTVLQLSDLAEASEMLAEAERWNCELVSRRSRRLGHDSEHACQARYKLSTLLLKVGDYDAAKFVSRENLESLHNTSATNPLVVRQNVQACMIAMKRRRVDQAMDVLSHLWTLERWHEHDLRTRDNALSVLVQATLFRHQFDEAEGWIRKRIELFGNQTKDKKSDFADKKHRGVYLELAICLNRQNRFDEAAEAARSALTFYRESEDVGKYDEPVCEVYNLLGKLYFDLKQWNKARFFLEKAAHGYAAKLGMGNAKSVKARELLKLLEKSMRLRQGLAERLARDRENSRGKKRF